MAKKVSQSIKPKSIETPDEPQGKNFALCYNDFDKIRNIRCSEQELIFLLDAMMRNDGVIIRPSHLPAEGTGIAEALLLLDRQLVAILHRIEDWTGSNRS